MIIYQFQVEKKGDALIGYEMIMGSDLMVKLIMITNLKRNVLEWYNAVVPNK